MMQDVHEIYAVRYAHHDRKSHENYILGDPHDDSPEPLAYFVWVIKGAGTTFVLDTGFDQAMADKRGRRITRPVADGLRAIQVSPDTVTDVVISHLHYDHCGNHTLFPQARYHLQDREMMYATGRYMCHAHQRIPFEADDVVAMVRRVFDERVVFHNGDEQLAPGLTVHHVGGPLDGAAVPARGDAARARGAGGRRHAPLCAHRAGPCLSRVLQRGGDAGRLRDDQAAGRLAGAHRARPRP